MLEDGEVRVVGVPDLKISLANIALKLDGSSGVPMPPGIDPGLAATAYFEAQRTTFASGTHVAEVEVDPGFARDVRDAARRDLFDVVPEGRGGTLDSAARVAR